MMENNKSENLSPNQKSERSIIKKYRKEIWRKFVTAITKYQLIQENDHIAVCVSGGKDSFLMAKCFQELQKYSKFPFELTFLLMDPGYSKINRNCIEKNAKKLEIPLTVFETEIFNVVADIADSPCYLCARMRRGYLYKNAKQHGCNKIALGHHYDDVIETILMSILYSGEVRTMMPKLHSQNFKKIQLIRPLYLVREQQIISWKNYNDLEFIRCACRFTEDIERSEYDSKRLEIKQLIEQLRKKSNYIEQNIFKSMENVNLDVVIGYKQNGEKCSFLDNY